MWVKHTVCANDLQCKINLLSNDITRIRSYWAQVTLLLFTCVSLWGKLTLLIQLLPSGHSKHLSHGYMHLNTQSISLYACWVLLFHSCLWSTEEETVMDAGMMVNVTVARSAQTWRVKTLSWVIRLSTEAAEDNRISLPHEGKMLQDIYQAPSDRAHECKNSRPVRQHDSLSWTEELD